MAPEQKQLIRPEETEKITRRNKTYCHGFAFLPLPPGSARFYVSVLLVAVQAASTNFASREAISS